VEVIHFPDDPRPSWVVHPVLGLGNFDGLHRGHLKIIERVMRGAAERGGTPMVMTFDPHPPRVVRPDKAPPLLMTKAQRLEALQRAGIQCTAVVHFTHELLRWEPEMFVRTVLADWLRVSEVWVGANFLFGRDRSGNFSILRTLGQRYGFRADKIDPVRYKEFVVSSTRVRRLVSEARMDEAGALLGHPYFLDGDIVEGRRKGKEIGFATMNLRTANELIPPDGVYATMAIMDGIVRAAVTNIGFRPTFGASTDRSIETHVLDFNDEVYGKALRLAFVQRLRDERHFEDVDALRAQIEADRWRAQRLFDRLSV
jgi:riboflavin kinase / FMN adenylyltransferase